jgi:ATP-binding cassette subfamily F protein 3
MITLSNVSLQFGGRFLFDEVNLKISTSDKYGLVGRNGAGKSTFLRLLTGELRQDSGSIDISGGITYGYLEQILTFDQNLTVFEAAKTAFEEVLHMEKEIERISKRLEEFHDYESDEYARLLDDLSGYSERLAYFDAAQIDEQCEKVLQGLGFKRDWFQKDVRNLSGGWQMRVELARLLLKKPDYFFLDEPTNHLDMESIIWLEDFLSNYNGGIVLISHDKKFLDNVTKKTIEVELGKLSLYNVSYSKYLAEKEQRKSIQEASYTNQQKYIETQEKLIDKFRAKASKASMAQSLIKKLDKLELIEVDKIDTSAMKIKFPEPPRGPRDMVKCENVSKSYGENVIFKDVNIWVERGDKVAFVGKNGEGKSTLSKIIAKVEDMSSGSVKIGDSVITGYFAQNQTELLEENKTVFQIVDEAAHWDNRLKVRAMLGAFLFSGSDTEKKVKVLSGGEKNRLAMAKLLINPFNLLIMDEPTNHLDIISIEMLKNALLLYEGTIIIVSHDRDFLSGLTNKTYEFKDGNVKEYLGDINEFLQKRALDNFRELELQKNQNAEVKMAKQKLNIDQNKKENSNAIHHIEKRIEQLENQIAEMENIIAKDNFYSQTNHQDILKNYEQLKNDLETKLMEWDELT